MILRDDLYFQNKMIELPVDSWSKRKDYGFNQQKRNADKFICIRRNTKRVINNLSMHLIKWTFFDWTKSNQKR